MNFKILINVHALKSNIFYFRKIYFKIDFLEKKSILINLINKHYSLNFINL